MLMKRNFPGCIVNYFCDVTKGVIYFNHFTQTTNASTKRCVKFKGIDKKKHSAM